MLLFIEQTSVHTATTRSALSVSPSTPFAVIIRKDGTISVSHESHNNGGYQNVTLSLTDLLENANRAGLHMTKLKAPFGILYINLHPDIPFSIHERSNHNTQCKLSYPTHNNGGYVVDASLDDLCQIVYTTFER
jgi:hypothetical protein